MKKVGLALGSGGIRGFAHIGAIRACEKHNIPINYIAGSSAGAIVGAYLALNGEVSTLAEIMVRLKRRDIIKLIDVTRSKKSLISGNNLKHFFKKLYQEKSFRNTLIPLKVVTCDLYSGKIVLLDKGKIAEAVLASMSVPGLFPPAEINGKLLVDGGVINATPVDVVSKMGADIVIGIDLTLAGKFEIKHPNMLVSIMRSFDVLRTQAAKYHIKNGVKKLVLVRPQINGTFNIFKQFSEAQKHIRKGEIAIERAMPKIKNLLGK